MERMIDKLITASDYEEACLSFSDDILWAETIAGQDFLTMLVALKADLTEEAKEQLKAALSEFLCAHAELLTDSAQITVKEPEYVEVSVTIWTDDCIEREASDKAFELIANYIQHNSFVKGAEEELKMLLTMESLLTKIKYISISAKSVKEGSRSELTLEKLYNESTYYCVNGTHTIHAKAADYIMQREELAMRSEASCNYDKNASVAEESYKLLALKKDYIDFLKKENGFVHVNAWRDSAGQKVMISILPKEFLEQKTVSKELLDQVKGQIIDKVTIGTQIEVVEPVFTEVDVKGQIYVHPYYENAQDETNQAICNCLDYLLNCKCMGDILTLKELYQKLTELACVIRIARLEFEVNGQGASVVDGNVVPEGNSLLMPGNIKVEFVSQLADRR